MGIFANWLENTAQEINKGFDAFAGSMDNLKFVRSAALYSQGRFQESAKLLASLPPDHKDQILELFKNSFKSLNSHASTQQVWDAPEFKSWVENKLQPLVASLKLANPANTTIKLSDYADKITNPDWVRLYSLFTHWHEKGFRNGMVENLANILYQSAKSNDMNIIKPFADKYLKAVRI